MGLWDKAKAAWTAMSGGAAVASNPVTAVANAVGAVAGAVGAAETKANNENLLVAGQSEGVLKDVAKTEERVSAANAARSDDKLLADARATRYRD